MPLLIGVQIIRLSEWALLDLALFESGFFLQHFLFVPFLAIVPTSTNSSWFLLVGFRHHPNSPCSWRAQCFRHSCCASDSAHIGLYCYVPICLFHHDHGVDPPSCPSFGCQCGALRRTRVVLVGERSSVRKYKQHP